MTDAKKIWETWGQGNALYTAWASDRSINAYQLFVLYAIDGHETITQKKIAEYTGLSKQTVNTIIRSLKTNGYVTLLAEGTDRREKQVSLTEAGAAFVEELLTPLHELENRVYDIMGETRIKQMMDSIALFNMIFEKELENQKNECSKK